MKPLIELLLVGWSVGLLTDWLAGHRLAPKEGEKVATEKNKEQIAASNALFNDDWGASTVCYFFSLADIHWRRSSFVIIGILSKW